MQNTFSLLSKHRQALMGFAIIWILLFHLNMENLFLKIKPIYYFLCAGYSGVDIFIFLSGFGLYFSSLKPTSTLQFYAKRLIRIYPAFIISLTIFQFLSHNYSILDFFLTLSTINFWTLNGTFDWYLSALISLYLAFPFYIILFKKYPLVSTLCISAISIGIVVAISLHDPSSPDLRKLLLARIPIFCIGIFCGLLSTHKEKSYAVVKNLAYALAIAAFLFYCFILTYHSGYLWFGFSWFPFILVTPALCVFLATLMDKLSTKSYINKCLNFMGTITLETYLMHTIIYKKLKISLMPSNNLLDFFIECGIKVVLSLITAYILHLVCTRIINKIEALFLTKDRLSD